MIPSCKILNGDTIQVLPALPDQSVHCCVTSPPYWGLRDYGVEGQLGLEKTPQEYVEKMVGVFREVRRVLRNDGIMFLNLGDSYASFRDGKATPDTTRGSDDGTLVPKGQAKNRMANTFAGTGIKHKDLVGIPWMVAFALRADGWYLRSDIIWHKPNPMPESVLDRPTKSHEYLFLLTKSDRYFYDAEAIKEPAKWERWGDQTVKKEQQGTAKWIGNRSKLELQALGKRNKRSVWTVTTKAYRGAHFATFPPDLIKPCILAGCPVGGTVIDPFFGSGTTGMVALELGRSCIGIELNPEYVKLAEKRTNVTPGLSI